VWYSRLDIVSVLKEYAEQFEPAQVKRTEKALAKARTKDSMAAFSKLTEMVDGRPRIVDQSPLITPLSVLADNSGREIFGELHHLLATYRATLAHDRR